MPYREAAAPPDDVCFKIPLKPIGWKARMWRTVDNSVTTMLRLDTPLDLGDLDGQPAHDLLLPFQPALRNLVVYCERGASVALPVTWSMGRGTIEHDRCTIFLHRVLDDPFGTAIAGMFRAAENAADITLFVALYDAAPNRLTLAIRDYDIGVGAEFVR